MNANLATMLWFDGVLEEEEKEEEEEKIILE